MSDSTNFTDSLAWDWEKTDPSRSGSSGDISKLFRHEITKNPGALALEAPHPNATIMAREVIQNSWDAARELQSQFENADEESPPFEIEFEYRNLEANDKENVVKCLDLASLASRVSGKNRQDIGLRESDCLDDLSTGRDLPVLYVREKGSTGMYGPWEGAKSKMYLALVSVGYTEKAQGAGGSFGYGKAGLIRSSAVRTVVAYTCFQERKDDPGVTRRLLGMTYWGQHEHRSQSCTGFARFADEQRRPFVNEQADQIANKLGISVRSPENPEELGTTFLLIEPTVKPEGLLKATERWWWPAIDDQDFFVSVTSHDGEKRHPRPRKDPHLRPFIRAREIATARQDNSPDEERKFSFNSISEGDQRYENPGALGLVADKDGWSYADELVSNAQDREPVEHKSLVALMRSPKMVVEYYEAGQSAPYVRGAFVAGESIDEVLRDTEPKGHDAWMTTSEDGELGAQNANIAKTVLRRIRNNVNTFRQSVKPSKPEPEDIKLPHFDNIMRKVMSGGKIGSNPPLSDVRPISIRLSQNLESAGDGKVRLTGSVRFSLSEHHEEDHADVEAMISYRFVEDSRLGSSCPIDIEPQADFDLRSGSPPRFRGTLVSGEEAVFNFSSDPYPSTWTARLIVNADVVNENKEHQDR